MELTVQNLYGLLLRSKLLPAEEAKALYAVWQREARGQSGDAAAFAAWLVECGHVTEYQAALLVRGHGEGYVLNEYTVLERLGKGRMAGVYKARHRLGQTVALKVLPPSKARDAALLARFQREAKLALKLRHPNVVRGFQVGQAGELHYLVMEYLEGETLEEVLARRKKLKVAEAVRLAYQALLGLQHIHEQGLVHRDLKPANLMLIPAAGDGPTTSCTVKILDIGLGRQLYDEAFETRDPELTGEGVLLGTPDYMAPEQARDPRSTDIRADVYSLGCVLYQMLAGQPPFPDTNIISQMIRHATEAPRPLAELSPAVPDGLAQIVGWMMAKEPAGRYGTPGRAAGALEVFLAADGTPASSPDLDPHMKPYLTWLEAENTKDAPPSGQVSAAALQATQPMVPLPGGPPPVPGRASAPSLPAAPPVPAATAKPTQTRPAVTAGREKRREKKARPAPPVAPSGSINVELVPPRPAGALPPAAPPASGLTRRDFAMFFLGVACAAAAGLAGFGVALLVKRLRREEE